MAICVKYEYVSVFIHVTMNTVSGRLPKKLVMVADSGRLGLG